MNLYLTKSKHEAIMAKQILNYGNSSIFNNWYNSIPKEIPCHLSWLAEDHFINACEGMYTPILEHNQTVTSIDPLGRRLVILGTLLGNVVVYDKHPRGASVSMNANKKLLSAYSGILFRGNQNDEKLKIIIGTKAMFPNIAEKIKYIKEMSK